MMYTDSLQEKNFLVKSGNIDSSYVIGYEFSRERLIIKTTVPRDKSIRSLVETAQAASPIHIELLNERGEVVDTIKVEEAKLRDWKVDATKSVHTPQYGLLELRLIYDIIRLD